MRSPEVATAVQESVIARALEVFEADERVLACWLEGSFARGTADAWSDVDLHVAVSDANWPAFRGQARDTLQRIGEVLAFGEVPFPWGTQLVLAMLSGPARLDFYIERKERIGEALRLDQPRLLFDRGGIEESLMMTRNIEPLIRARLQELVQTFFFGGMWPSRLAGREEWGTLYANGLIIIYQFLVPALLIQDSPEHYFRPHFHNERQLSAARRSQVDDLVASVGRAFEGIEKGKLSPEAVVSVYEQLLSTIWREFRNACETHNVHYPDSAEAEIRAYHRRQLGMFAHE
jgi:predicted nucleotidyltransferase